MAEQLTQQQQFQQDVEKEIRYQLGDQMVQIIALRKMLDMTQPQPQPQPTPAPPPPEPVREPPKRPEPIPPQPEQEKPLRQTTNGSGGAR
jgi:hypothetical protein